MTTLPRTPGRDFAGVVAQGPPEAIGKRVWGTGGLNGFSRDGAFAEWIVVPSTALAQMPGNLSFAQAAACGVGFLTAKLMLDLAAPGAGEHVLVLGSSGAVGSAAVQLARLGGAIPVQTYRQGSASDAVNITQDIAPQIAKITSGTGIAVVIDTVGEAVLFKKALEALGPNGRYIIISAAKTPGFQFTFDALELYGKNKSIRGLSTLPVSFEDAVKHMEALRKGFEEESLKPPSVLEEVDLVDERAVIEAFEKVKAGSKAKQIIVNKNV
jgi:NADPH:quinone reductase-like Zn-dependent oxidoreductase